jgi:hypothetical protein
LAKDNFEATREQKIVLIMKVQVDELPNFLRHKSDLERSKKFAKRLEAYPALATLSIMG